MPRLADHDERRREITYAVWLLIAARGPAAVTLRNVAAEAGVSVGRIQHYFPTKEAMLLYGCRAMVEHAERWYAGACAGLDARQRLRLLVRHAIPRTPQFRVGITVWYAYLALAVADPDVAAVLEEGQRGAEEEAARLLDQLRPPTPDDDDQPSSANRALARRLMSLADGLAVRVLTGAVTADEACAQLDAELGAT